MSAYIIPEGKEVSLYTKAPNGDHISWASFNLGEKMIFTDEDVVPVGPFDDPVYRSLTKQGLKLFTNEEIGRGNVLAAYKDDIT